MIGDEKYSDAVFLIGLCKETAVRIPVATCFLKIESEPFAAMFSENWIEKEILIKETDESVMYSLLRWMYCHELVYESGKLDALLRLAHQYEVHSLFSFVKRHALTADHMSLWSIASFAHAFSQPNMQSGLMGLPDVKQECIQEIKGSPEEHIECGDFLHASC